MNKDRFIALTILALFLSGCATNKPVWPVDSTNSKLGHIESRKNAERISLFVREPNVPLGDEDNFDFFVAQDQNARIEGLLRSMSLELFFEASLSDGMGAIGKELLDHSQKLRLKEAEYNVKLASIRGAETPLKNLSKSQIVPYVQKRSIAQKYLAKETPRLVLAYGLSSDLSRLGVSAELLSLHKTELGETIRCSNLFDVSRTVELPLQIKAENSPADLARNFHIVREEFRQAGNALASLVSSHLSSNDIYMRPLDKNDDSRIVFSDYVTFDKRFYHNATARVSENQVAYMYSQIPSHEICGSSYLTVQASQKALGSMAETLKKERKKLNKFDEAGNKKFVREQGLRNQQVLYKRLGLNNKH